MTADKTLSLFVFVDAFGWEVLRAHRFLDDVLTTRAPLRTVLGYSSTCAPTFLTGASPREHQHFSFFYHSPHGSPFGACRWLALLPRSLTSRGRVRRLISRAVQRWHGYTGYFQLYNVPFEHLPHFDYSEKKDIYRPGGIAGGQRTVFDHLRDAGVPFALSDWRLSEGVNLERLEAELREGRPRFAYLYLAHMDGVMHEHGPGSPHVDRKLAWYEERIRRVLDLAASRYRDVRLHVFSDHGQADVTQTIDLITPIERTGLRFGEDYVAMYDSTMARFWFRTDRARPAIEAVLADQDAGRTLGDAELASLGCDFPGRKYGELIWLVQPGALICPSFMGEAPLGGMHGYDPAHPASWAMHASNVRPDVAPASLQDMFGLMLREASLPAPAPAAAGAG
jgi:hypothetical protein